MRGIRPPPVPQTSAQSSGWTKKRIIIIVAAVVLLAGAILGDTMIRSIQPATRSLLSTRLPRWKSHQQKRMMLSSQVPRLLQQRPRNPLSWLLNRRRASKSGASLPKLSVILTCLSGIGRITAMRNSQGQVRHNQTGSAWSRTTTVSGLVMTTAHPRIILTRCLQLSTTL